LILMRQYILAELFSPHHLRELSMRKFRVLQDFLSLSGCAMLDSLSLFDLNSILAINLEHKSASSLFLNIWNHQVLDQWNYEMVKS